jgi:beta-glucosidase
LGELTLDKTQIAAGDTLDFSVRLTNSGAREAEEVVQVYLSDLEASVVVPVHKLVGFKRLRLAAGESQTLRFTLTPDDMMLVSESGERRLEPGAFRLIIGTCSPGARGVSLGAAESVHTDFYVTPIV